MKCVKVELEHCYGIRTLKYDFDFEKRSAYAIYAPNGMMKSSLAKTFKDLQGGNQPGDRIYPEREAKCIVVDEDGQAIAMDRVLVVLPYDEEFGLSERTCTLLVDAGRREEYAKLVSDTEKAKGTLLDLVKKQAGSRANLEREISSAFMKTSDDLEGALTRIKAELTKQTDAPFAEVNYDVIFGEKVLNALKTKDLGKLVEDYITRYNELLDKSTYFQKGTFDYYNAEEIARNLNANGFFRAGHTATLRSVDKSIEIKNQEQLVDLITKEKNDILKDNKLRKAFDAVDKQLGKNVDVRSLRTYLQRNEHILPHLDNLDLFKENVLKSYLKKHEEAYLALMETYEKAEVRKKEIEDEASKQATKWQEAIDIFNSRFSVPFKLEAKNKTKVILGREDFIDLGFTYDDGDGPVEIDRKNLLQALSTGERKALYILNVIFEIQTRVENKQDTLIVVDDIADSFDYQNKYAIVQYLRDISENDIFKQIILTHNFDFLRTIEGRFVTYSNCLMAQKSDTGIVLEKASGIKNIFVKDWKGWFFLDDAKKVACIPFLRNLVEFSRGETAAHYITLTSMVHWKRDTDTLKVADLDDIFRKECDECGASHEPEKKVIDLIDEVGDAAEARPPGLLLLSKVVLSLAIRMRAERYMAEKIADEAFLAGIASNQTQKLLSKSLIQNSVKHSNTLRGAWL
ncbi:hypothetical protein [Amaricoccus sp. B4]|uniref:hypothetical protein n=1 Tax=Amaricoccus sp. B4 TaxID=3368557 RepID=UPI0037221B59